MISDDFELFSRFLGQVAHDYNNLLTPFLAYPQLIRPGLKENSGVQDLLDSIENTAKDMAHMNNQLLTLSGRDSSNKTLHKATQLLNLIFSQTTNVIPPSIIVQASVPDDLPEIICNADDIAQAVENIVINAVEAMNGNGELILSAELTNLNRGSPFAPTKLYKGPFISLKIKDNGPGIPSDIKDRLFAPFATTKKNTTIRGSGLGLAIVYKTLKSHDGFCEISSNQEHGTEVTLFLPCETSTTEQPGDQTIDTLTKTPEQPNMIPCDRKKILLLDDEKVILKLFQMIIKSSLPDYTVDTAENGVIGLNLFKQHHHVAIVMDLHMPVMDGQTTFIEMEKLCNERSWEMPSVIFCTGFAPSEVINRVVMGDNKHCLLSKPITGEVLVETIRKRLEA